MEEMHEASTLVESNVEQDNSEHIAINKHEKNLKRKLEYDEETIPKQLKSSEQLIEDDETDDGAFCTIVSIK